MIKSSKTKSDAGLYQNESYHMPVSENFRGDYYLGVDFQWLERQRGDCLNAWSVKSHFCQGVKEAKRIITKAGAQITHADSSRKKGNFKAKSLLKKISLEII